MNGLMSSSHVLMQITRSFTSADRIVQVLDTEIDITEPVILLRFQTFKVKWSLNR